MSQRIERVAGEIKEEIGKIIHDELKDPRIGFVTITKVDLSRDLRHAVVYYSLLGEQKEVAATRAGLNNCRGFVRKLLGQRMKLRYIPEIVFKLDKGIEYSIHISKVLEKIKDKDESDKRQKGN